MSEIISFYAQHGLILTIIAIVGICILGALKYGEVFSKIDETKRHLIYVAISVFISMLGGAIYMIWAGSFEVGSFFLFGANIFALNQMFYNIFKATTLNDLITKILDKFFVFLTNFK